MPGNPDSAIQEMLEIMRDIRDMMHSRESSIPAGPRVADEDGAPSPHSGTGDDLPGIDTTAIFNSSENPQEPTCPSSSEHYTAQLISPNPPVELPGERPSPNAQFTANSPTNSNSPLKHRWFGLKQEKERKVQTHPTAANYDYRVKYPKDPRYHELDEEARVWWVYLDEASDFDNDMVGELGDSLDILLVFAGLFSAVLTTFVAQTSQALSQDYTQLSSSYLQEVTALLRANGNETTLAGIPLTSTAFAPATTDIWLNGLWFISLTLSLSVALFAVLAKQWLRQYMSIITGTPLERVFIRQFRFDGLKKWHVQAIIGVLPVLLHISLVLFLVGLMKLDPKIPIPDITVALTLLSAGVIEVPISYDGKTIMLQRDDVLPWILDIYRQSNYDRESELQLPALVWNSLFDWYRDKVGMEVVRQTLHGYLGAHEEYTSNSILEATQYLSDAIYFRYMD
ncbi:hypothetical protein LENED_012688 [Lentinula edodes]|uniref:DUF6535 domain-containing protein n=1 Tax=Lentinula edodes TaxID=5353 RepID=A0A1Q3ET68_LENED|nr:hypothetical protein LENED_012688 [Lentinula edodes]